MTKTNSSFVSIGRYSRFKKKISVGKENKTIRNWTRHEGTCHILYYCTALG